MSSFHTLYFKDLSMISFSCAGIPGSVLYQEANRSLLVSSSIAFLRFIAVASCIFFSSFVHLLKDNLYFFEMQASSGILRKSPKSYELLHFQKIPLYFLTSFYFCVKIQILRHIHHLNSINYTL